MNILITGCNGQLGNEMKLLSSTEDYYRHVIAEKTMAEQRLIVSLLRQNGILSILTPPENLSVDVINKYLEIRRKS